MAMILVVTSEHTYRIEGDTFHTQRDIGQVIIQAKAENESKLKTVAVFNCNEIIGIAYADNFK